MKYHTVLLDNALFFVFFAMNFVTAVIFVYTIVYMITNRARQLYKNISMLFLFPVKYGKLSTGVNAQRFLSCYGKSSIMENYLTKQHA